MPGYDWERRGFPLAKLVSSNLQTNLVPGAPFFISLATINFDSNVEVLGARIAYRVGFIAVGTAVDISGGFAVRVRRLSPGIVGNSFQGYKWTSPGDTFEMSGLLVADLLPGDVFEVLGDVGTGNKIAIRANGFSVLIL